jgi:hypothetical protein
MDLFCSGIDVKLKEIKKVPPIKSDHFGVGTKRLKICEGWRMVSPFSGPTMIYCVD